MFRRGWLLHRDRIYSDEDFFVAFGRDWLVYSERGRRMTITIDASSRGVGILSDTIGRWDDDPMHRVAEKERERITTNIKRALESQGENVIVA